MNRIIKHFLEHTTKLGENWEKPLATGYEKDKDIKDAESDLDTSKEKVPGEKLFPTYDDLISRRNAMKDSDRRFTQSYDEFSSNPEGVK